MAVFHPWIPPGAAPDEQDVLEEAATVAEGLAAAGWEPVPVELGLNLQEAARRLTGLQPAFVFNLVESVMGQGALVHLAPALLEYLRLPYTGAPADAIYLTSQKILAKRLMQAAGLPTPPWAAGGDDLPEEAPFPGPFIVKSLWEHASVDLDDQSVVQDWPRLRGVLDRRAGSRSGSCFAERFIDGREFNLSVLAGPAGPEVLSPAEIRFVDFPPGKPRMVGYRAKWEEDSFEYRNTVRSFLPPGEDVALVARLAGLALDCWKLFGLRGYARVDFRVDDSGQPWIMEVNTNPCISPDAGFAAACRQTGYSFPEVLTRIIRDLNQPVSISSGETV